MSVPTTGALAAGRGVLVGCAIVCLAAAAHLAGGGPSPDAPTLLAASAAAGGVSVVLARRRLSMRVLLVLLGGGQLGLHHVFLHGVIPSSVASSPADHSGHSMAGHSIAGHAMASPLPEPLMIAAHVVGTVVTAAALAHGERALWALLGWLMPLAGSGAAVGVAVPVVGPRVPVGRFAPTRRIDPQRWVPRRGPPALVLRSGSAAA